MYLSPADPDKVLLVSSTHTVVEFVPSLAGSSTICNMEIKVSGWGEVGTVSIFGSQILLNLDEITSE